MIKKIKSKFQARKLKNAQKREYWYKLHNQPSSFDDAILSWVAPEMVRHERGKTWKILMSLFVISFVIWGIYTGAWTFSLAMITFTAVYYLVLLEHPKDVEIKISEIGVKVGSRKYSYSNIKAFWIIYEPPYVKTLNIRVNGKYNGEVTIQLDGQEPGPLREYLLEKIPEMDGKNEKLTDILIRLLKI